MIKYGSSPIARIGRSITPIKPLTKNTLLICPILFEKIVPTRSKCDLTVVGTIFLKRIDEHRTHSIISLNLSFWSFVLLSMLVAYKHCLSNYDISSAEKKN